MVALEPPSSMDADSLRDKKVEVLEAVRRWSREEFPKHAVGAQYEGYLGEEGVANDSRTPTYAAMRLYVDNWRWQGVPFYLRSGTATANALSVCIQPDEGFHLRFETKVPDQEMKTKPVDMDFHYQDEFTQALPEAYERLLEDAIEGDASLFIRGDQIEQAWNIVDPLLQCWADSTLGAVHSYDVGSWGPEAATALLAQDGYAWLNLCGQHP